MSAAADPTDSARIGRAAGNRALIRMFSMTALGFGVFLSGFVINEPAPYELYMATLIVGWAL
ncbi:hypothetical protein NY486_19290, partial [Enterobacter hormaechei]|nr:hypothetical protein [Enterobacter hormaechei]